MKLAAVLGVTATAAAVVLGGSMATARTNSLPIKSLTLVSERVAMNGATALADHHHFGDHHGGYYGGHHFGGHHFGDHHGGYYGGHHFGDHHGYYGGHHFGDHHGYYGGHHFGGHHFGHHGFASASVPSSVALPMPHVNLAK